LVLLLGMGGAIAFSKRRSLSFLIFWFYYAFITVVRHSRRSSKIVSKAFKCTQNNYKFNNLDFVKFAESMNLKGYRITSTEDFLLTL
jgi:hypothetical protein